MKVKNLIDVLKKLPPEAPVHFQQDGTFLGFDYVDIERSVHFIEYDDDGIEKKKPEIETTEESVTIKLC